jgi:hypothetical protein
MAPSAQEDNARTTLVLIYRATALRETVKPVVLAVVDVAKQMPPAQAIAIALLATFV